jgi:hypothetical protein
MGRSCYKERFVPGTSAMMPNARHGRQRNHNCPSRSKKPSRGMYMQFVDGNALAVDAMPRIHHIVVGCNGLPQGDSALRLCENLARQTSATVRAVAWLPVSFMETYTSPRHGPIETWLNHVTEQLYRTTRLPGFWRLTLLVGDKWRELVRICAEEHADLVVMPHSECHSAVGINFMTSTGIPVACVSDDISDPDTPHVFLMTSPDPRCQQTAQIVTSMLKILHTSVPSHDRMYSTQTNAPMLATRRRTHPT